MGFFDGIFGKSDKKVSSEKDATVKKGFLGFGSSGPKEKLTKAEVKKLNKHWARTINRRDVPFLDFIALKDWNSNPLVARTLEVLNPIVKVAGTTLSAYTRPRQDEHSCRVWLSPRRTRIAECGLTW